MVSFVPGRLPRTGTSLSRNMVSLARRRLTNLALFATVAATLTVLTGATAYADASPATPHGATSSTPIGTVSSSSIITTLTGTHVPGFSGDGGLADLAQVYKPRDESVGPDGSIYIADTYNNRIRKIDPDGVITTVAGNGSQTCIPAASCGDGGPATSASLAWPHDVTVDSAGDIFIADSNHSRIREVTPDGIIHTIAGTGREGFSGNGGPAVDARLKIPKGVVLFAGSLYFADTLNERIRAINLTTGIITTVAGNGVRGFAGDGGPALDAEFNIPQRIAIDAARDLFIADTQNNRIREVTPDGIIHTIIGTGQQGFGGDGGIGTAAKISVPRGLAVAPDGSLFFSDTGNNRVRRWDPTTGIVTTIVGTGKQGYSGDGGPAGSATLYDPRGLTFDPEGDLIIADCFNNVVRIVRAS